MDLICEEFRENTVNIAMEVENKSLFSYSRPHELSERLRHQQLATLLPKDTSLEFSTPAFILIRIALVFVLAIFGFAVAWTFFFPDRCSPEGTIAQIFSVKRRQRSKDAAPLKVLKYI